MAKVDARARIIKLIGDAIDQENVELEMILTRTEKMKRLDSLHLQAFLQKNGFSRAHHDLELDIAITPDPNLRINYRITLIGTKNIADFCSRKVSLRNFSGDDIRVIEKSSVASQRESLVVYDGDLALKHEKDISDDLRQVTSILTKANSSVVPKYYRLKNRISFEHPDHAWRIDLTEVKSSSPNVATFEGSNIHNAPIVRELEVEFLKDRKGVPKDKVYESLVMLCPNILRIIRRSPIILPPSAVVATINGYMKTIRGKIVAIKTKSEFTNDMYLNKKPKTLTRGNVTAPELSMGTTNIFRDGPYAVAYKADGENCQVYIDSESCVNIIYDTLNIARLEVKCDGHTDCICSAELIAPNEFSKIPQILLYETFFYNGKPVWQEDLYTRANMYKKIAKSIEGCTTHSISSKDHYFAETSEKLYEQVKQLVDTSSKPQQTFENDGLIFTKITGTYTTIEKGGITDIFKWKPADKNSVDARISINPELKEAVLTVGHDPSRYATDNVLTTLYSGINSRRSYIEKEIGRIRVVPIPGRRGQYNMQLGDNESFVDHLQAATYIDLYDNTIVECSFFEVQVGSDPKTRKFVPFPIRNREDKTEILRTKGLSGAVNDYTMTVVPVLKSINDPIKLADLTSSKRPKWSAPDDDYYEDSNVATANDDPNLVVIRKFNNGVKTQVYTLLVAALTASMSKTPAELLLLDIGSGRGGDIDKYSKTGLMRVLGVDKSYSNIFTLTEGAYARLAKHASKVVTNPDYLFLALDASKHWMSTPVDEMAHTSVVHKLLNTESPNDKFNNSMMDAAINGAELPAEFPDSLGSWSGILGKAKFDMVVSMFVFHYFLENEETLANAVKNVADNLKSGGLFSAMMLDGEAVDKEIRTSGEIKSVTKGGTLVRSLKKSSGWKFDADPTKNYGKNIDVFIASIASYAMTEPIVDFKLLDIAFAKEGMVRADDVEMLNGRLYETFFTKLAANSLENTQNMFYFMDEDTRAYINMHRLVTYRKK